MTDSLLPAVFTRRQALDAGYTRAQIAHLLSSGRWQPLRWGAYCRSESTASTDPDQQHRLLVLAALLAHHDRATVPWRQPVDPSSPTASLFGPTTAASHLSAACLHGWPRPWSGWSEPQVTVHAGTGPTRRRSGVVVHAATLRSEDVCIREGILATTPPRTLADLLRRAPVADAVALADHALRADHVTYDDVAAALRAQAGWPFVARARQALSLVDPRRESWLESWSFVRLHSMGIPMPVPQVTIVDERGRFVARVDAYWPEHGLVGEADGQVKYDLTGPYAPQALNPDAVVAWGQQRLDDQRRRHERLLGLGLQVVRWSAADAGRGRASLAERLSDRMRSGDPSRFRGRAILPAPLPWAEAAAEVSGFAP